MKKSAEKVDCHLGGGLVHRRGPHGSGVAAVAQLSQSKASVDLQQGNVNERRLYCHTCESKKGIMWNNIHVKYVWTGAEEAFCLLNPKTLVHSVIIQYWKYPIIKYWLFNNWILLNIQPVYHAELLHWIPLIHLLRPAAPAVQTGGGVCSLSLLAWGQHAPAAPVVHHT